MMMTSVMSLDLGSTRIKAAIFDGHGSIVKIKARNTPVQTGIGLIRESDSDSYLQSATELIDELLSELTGDIRIGLASQRSSFLLWNKKDGSPVTPLISWQDRRAHSWCLENRKSGQELIRGTGLPLSPHYAGPKLASLFTVNDQLKRTAVSGHILFGTLETYLIWKLTQGQVHQTDLSMAARTLLADSTAGGWSEKLLQFFGVPSNILPTITPTWGKQIPIKPGGIITATVADQAAGVISVMENAGDVILINLGTGGFVSRPTGSIMKFIPGYLSGPISSGPNQEMVYSLEGTINGIAKSLDGLGDEQCGIPDGDLSPDGFCLPDTTGVGSPYWLADIFFLLSDFALNATSLERKYVIMEGIIFRVCQIIRDVCKGQAPPKIFLSGGLANEEFIYRGIASCLEHPICRIDQKETTLLGAYRLASGMCPDFHPAVTISYPEDKLRYLRKKFFTWKDWLERQIESHRV
jgi:glycerol kinase